MLLVVDIPWKNFDRYDKVGLVSAWFSGIAMLLIEVPTKRTVPSIRIEASYLAGVTITCLCISFYLRYRARRLRKTDGGTDTPKYVR